MTKMRQWSLLTAVAVLAVLAAGWFLLVSPKHSQAAQLREQAAGQEAANETLRSQLAALTVQARNLPQQRAKLYALRSKIPADPALSALVRRLIDAADRAGVTFLSVQPGAPTALAPGAVPAPAGSTTTAAGQLLVIPVTVQVSGGFFQLEQYLTNLEDLPRAFLVGGLTVAPAGSTTGSTTGVSSAGTTGSLAATITGRVFMTTTRPAAAAPVAPPAPTG